MTKPALSVDRGAGRRVADAAADRLALGLLDAYSAISTRWRQRGLYREAIAGMRQALGRDALVVYEDHGGDPTHALTRHLLGERGLRVAFLGDHATTPIEAPEQLTALKPDRTRGYNLLALPAQSRWASLLSP